MFGRLISAIISALRGAAMVMLMLIGLPGRLLALLLGGPLTPPPATDSPLVRSLEEQLATFERDNDSWHKAARLISIWAADALIAGGPVPVRSRAPRDLREWLPGLSRRECEILISSDKSELVAHARGHIAIPGVRRVHKLEPLAWPVSSPVRPTPAAQADSNIAPRAITHDDPAPPGA